MTTRADVATATSADARARDRQTAYRPSRFRLSNQCQLEIASCGSGVVVRHLAETRLQRLSEYIGDGALHHASFLRPLFMLDMITKIVNPELSLAQQARAFRGRPLQCVQQVGNFVGERRLFFEFLLLSFFGVMYRFLSGQNLPHPVRTSSTEPAGILPLRFSQLSISERQR